MKNRNIAIYGLYASIFLIFGLVPNIGFINFGPFGLTTMALPITVITIHKKKYGAIFGLFMFGLTAIIALPYLGAKFIVRIGVLKSIVTLFVSRILIIIPIALYIFLTKNKKINLYLEGSIIALLVSVFNTLFVLFFLSLFDKEGFAYWFILLGITNILPEWTIIPVLGSYMGKIGHMFYMRDSLIQNSLYN